MKSAADTFRPNPSLDVGKTITELKVGEALVSLLQPDGAPSPVERTLIKPPRSRVGPISEKERAMLRSISPVEGKYDTLVNRESAEEMLAAKAGSAADAARRAQQDAETVKAQADAAKAAAAQAKIDERTQVAAQREADRAAAAQAKAEERATAAAARVAARPTLTDRVIQSAARSAASSVGRQIAGRLGGELVRGILGGLFKAR